MEVEYSEETIGRPIFDLTVFNPLVEKGSEHVFGDTSTHDVLQPLKIKTHPVPTVLGPELEATYMATPGLEYITIMRLGILELGSPFIRTAMTFWGCNFAGKHGLYYTSDIVKNTTSFVIYKGSKAYYDHNGALVEMFEILESRKTSMLGSKRVLVCYAMGKKVDGEYYNHEMKVGKYTLKKVPDVDFNLSIGRSGTGLIIEAYKKWHQLGGNLAAKKAVVEGTRAIQNLLDGIVPQTNFIGVVTMSNAALDNHGITDEDKKALALFNALNNKRGEKSMQFFGRLFMKIMNHIQASEIAKSNAN